MTRRARPADPLEGEIDAALDPGHFLSDRAWLSFVSDNEEMEHEIAKLIGAEPARAVALYETFLAGCHEKADEIDDDDTADEPPRSTMARPEGRVAGTWV